jgi:hypothetical protein
MRTLATLFFALASLFGSAPLGQTLAGDYTYANRPNVVFPGGPKNAGIVHVSPYPQSGRAASVWAAEPCWRDCGRQCTWNMETCVRATNIGADACRPKLDACDRACQRNCRIRGGPLLILDF